MSKFSAIVCDHCDVRDVLEHPPKNGVKSYILQILPTNETGMQGDPLKNVQADLCAACYKNLEDAVFTLMTQQPKKQGF